MGFKKYLNLKEDLPLLKRFAVLGKSNDFDKKLDYLIRIAEPELWNQTDVHTQRKNSTIFYYIIHTFDRCFNQEKIFVDEAEENAFFNTGLMNVQGNEIFGHFVQSNFYDKNDKNSNYWYFKGFIKNNDKEFITKCDSVK